MEDYKLLHNRKVGLIVNAIIAGGNYSQTGSSLVLEGILTSETKSQVKLKAARTTQNDAPSFKTPMLYVNKDKIVLLYLLKDPEE